MRNRQTTHRWRARLQTRPPLPEAQNCSVRLRKSGQSNITTRSQVNREIRCGVGRAFYFILTRHLNGVVSLDKCIQIPLYPMQGQLKSSPQGCREKFLQQEAIKVLAEIVIGPAGLVHFQMLYVRTGKERFKGVPGKQTAIFTRFPSVNVLDCDSTTLEKRKDTTGENVDGVHRAPGRKHFCKCDAGIAVHDGFDVNTFRSGRISDFLHAAEEKHCLEERVSRVGRDIYLFLFFL